MRELKPFRIGTLVDKTNAKVEDSTHFINYEINDNSNIYNKSNQNNNKK